MRHPSPFPILIAALSLATTLAPGQTNLPVPQASPAASVSQTVGISRVDVTYNRPAVKGRSVWGGLVSYGEVWRAGANQNTAISFSTAVRIAGTTLPAGTYGLHMIPARGPWTIILSRNASSWGSYFYRQEEDALRFTTDPGQNQFHEWLQFEFSDITDSSATLSLVWEKIRVPIPLVFDTPALVLAHARDTYLRGPAGFTALGYTQAAEYALRHGGNLEEALRWADRSLEYGAGFRNLRLKAEILEVRGEKKEAAALRERAMKVATEADLNTYGYSLLQSNQVDEAIKVFTANVKAHPDSWNVYDSLAEGLETRGDVKGAIANYERALKLVGDQANKQRISTTLTRLRGTGN